MRGSVIIICAVALTGCQPGAQADANLGEAQIEICARHALTYETLQMAMSDGRLSGRDATEEERAGERQNELVAAINANSTLNMMIAKGCELPERAPHSLTYINNAIECEALSYRQRNGEDASVLENACNRSLWQPGEIEDGADAGEERLEALQRGYQQ